MGEKDLGNPDKELENGPIDKRECRDILCCLLMFAAIAASGYVIV